MYVRQKSCVFLLKMEDNGRRVHACGKCPGGELKDARDWGLILGVVFLSRQDLKNRQERGPPSIVKGKQAQKWVQVKKVVMFSSHISQLRSWCGYLANT